VLHDKPQSRLSPAAGLFAAACRGGGSVAQELLSGMHSVLSAQARRVVQGLGPAGQGPAALLQC
jgi:hypothetical protein